MKRLSAILLSIIMILSLCSCGEKPETVKTTELSYEIGDTGGLKVPFGNGETIRIVATDEVNTQSNYIFEKLGEITGLDIQVDMLPVSSAKEKMQVILASGNLPEILGTAPGSLAETNALAAQNAFEPINPHLDEMPNFKRIFADNEENDWIFKSYAADDGNVYIFPVYDMERDVNHGMLYRKDIFDKHGLSMWDSPESFYEALKKLKEEYPDSYPLTSKTGVNIVANYGVAWGGLSAYNTYYDENEKTWKYSDTDDKMKEMLDFFNKLYKEGLLDPEFLTNTQAAWTSKMTGGKSFVTYDWIGRLDMWQEQTTIPGYDIRYANPVGPDQTVISLPKISNYGSTVAKGDKADLSMKLMDFWYSDAGAELMTLGIRGETFEFIDDGKAARYLEFGEGEKVETMSLAEKYGMWTQGTYRRVDKRSNYFNFTEREQEAQELPKNHKGFAPADPVLAFNDKDTARIAELRTALSKKFEEVMFKYIIGQEAGDAAWENWCKTAEKLGAEELVKIYNEAQKKLES